MNTKILLSTVLLIDIKKETVLSLIAIIWPLYGKSMCICELYFLKRKHFSDKL